MSWYEPYVLPCWSCENSSVFQMIGRPLTSATFSKRSKSPPSNWMNPRRFSPSTRAKASRSSGAMMSVIMGVPS